MKVFSAFAVVGVTAVGLASCGGSAKNYAAKNTKFKIGVSGPLTGDAAVYGLGVKNSAQLAVDEINAMYDCEDLIPHTGDRIMNA